jgi:hypothetical protein
MVWWSGHGFGAPAGVDAEPTWVAIDRPGYRGTLRSRGGCGGAGEAGFGGVRDAGDGPDGQDGPKDGRDPIHARNRGRVGRIGFAAPSIPLHHAANAAWGRWLASASHGARSDAGIDHAAEPHMLYGGTDREEPPAASTIANTPADARGTPSPSLRSGPPPRAGEGLGDASERAGRVHRSLGQSRAATCCPTSSITRSDTHHAQRHPRRPRPPGAPPTRCFPRAGPTPPQAPVLTSGTHPTPPSGSPDRRRRWCHRR